MICCSPSGPVPRVRSARDRIWRGHPSPIGTLGATSPTWVLAALTPDKESFALKPLEGGLPVDDRAWHRRVSRLRRPLTDQHAQPPKRGFCRLAHRRLLLVDRRISSVGRIFGSKLTLKGGTATCCQSRRWAWVASSGGWAAGRLWCGAGPILSDPGDGHIRSGGGVLMSITSTGGASMASTPRIPKAEITGLYGGTLKRIGRKHLGEVPAAAASAGGAD
jgi:hypothetical protein